MSYKNDSWTYFDKLVSEGVIKVHKDKEIRQCEELQEILKKKFKAQESRLKEELRSQAEKIK
ncbi:hypothetical protein QCA50_013684 [Cerrena zonata]|uniref:Uncharacterized protein n=1 Tax=Cerrena zonata TaxID=2478898 RepID=A0AAW0FUM3_9APHY